jgi:hypothetical protein
MGEPFGSDEKSDGKFSADVPPSCKDFATAIVYAAVLPVASIVRVAAGK